jgi:hypothetical protein
VGDDLLAQMRRNPAADWTIADVQKLCRRYGLLYRPGSGTSHNQVKHPRAKQIVTVPARRPIKPVYIRKLVRYIDEYGDAS